jgi:hypothetical protein
MGSTLEMVHRETTSSQKTIHQIAMNPFSGVTGANHCQFSWSDGKGFEDSFP